MKKVFLSGEMLKSFIRKSILGEEIITTPYELCGFKNCNLFKEKSFLIEEERSNIMGELVLLSDEQLWNLDRWKEIPVLQRREIKDQKENSNIFIYILGENLSTLSIKEDLFKQLDYFNKCNKMNKVGLCDLHLLFPCSLVVKDTNVMVSNKIDVLHAMKTKNSVLCVEEDDECLSSYYIRKMKEYNNSESDGEFVRDIHRISFGAIEISLNLDGEEYTEYGFAYISKHIMTSVGMFAIVFPSITTPVQLELCAFCGNGLSVVENDTKIPITEWMSNRGFKLEGSPKASLFAYSTVDRDEIAKCLACEMEPLGNIVGEISNNWINDNFAQYDIAKVYASDKCLIEIIETEEINIKSRLNSQSIEMYFIELLMLQEAAISHVSAKVYDYLNHEFGKEKQKDVQASLYKLSKEAANAILFVDYKKLRYPTVRISAKKIAERFGIGEEFDKYYKCREVLEQMISIDTFESEKIEGTLMNTLLLLLAMIQVLPTFIQLAYSIINNQVTMKNFQSGIIGGAGCILLYLIYLIAHKRAIRKSRNRLLGKK